MSSTAAEMTPGLGSDAHLGTRHPILLDLDKTTQEKTIASQVFQYSHCRVGMFSPQSDVVQAPAPSYWPAAGEWFVRLLQLQNLC